MGWLDISSRGWIRPFFLALFSSAAGCEVKSPFICLMELWLIYFSIKLLVNRLGLILWRNVVTICKKTKTQITVICDCNCWRSHQLHCLHISPPIIDSIHPEAVPLQDILGTMTCLYFSDLKMHFAHLFGIFMSYTEHTEQRWERMQLDRGCTQRWSTKSFPQNIFLFILI